MPGVTMEDVLRFTSGEPLGDIFCLTFVKNVGAAEALRRMGALPETVRTRSLEEGWEAQTSYEAGYPDLAWALDLGDWTVVIEPNGFNGTFASCLPALSQGTEAVSVLRHDYAEDTFDYAVDGTVVTGFELLAPEYRYGNDPDLLLEHMRAAGLPTEEGEDEAGHDISPSTRGLYVAGQITGVMLHPEALDGELLFAEVQPWFSPAPPPYDRLRDAALAVAIRAAPPRRAQHLAVAEIRRLAALLDLTDAPGLSEALAAAENGEPRIVTPDSELGRQVRSWLTASVRAGSSLNDPGARDQMTEDERQHAFHLGWFAKALRPVLWQRPKDAFVPVTDGPPPLGDQARRDAILAALRR
ncbi:DUF6461 domain-containing protein [Spirillospora sp. NPDC050679]